MYSIAVTGLRCTAGQPQTTYAGIIVTHTESPSRDPKELALERVQLPDLDTAYLGVVRVGAEDIALRLGASGHTGDEESVHGEG